jgi:hypothetical protein
MSKKAYLLLSVVASLALGGVLFVTPESKNLRAENPTSYSKSITITSSLLKTSGSTAYTIVVNGLTVGIGAGVYNQKDTTKITISNTLSAGATISFPSVNSVTGPHGTGYASVTWVRPSSGTYCNNVGIAASNAANESVTVDATLNSSAPVTTAIPSDHSSAIKLFSYYSSNYSTALTSITVTYNCISA